MGHRNKRAPFSRTGKTSYAKRAKATRARSLSCSVRPTRTRTSVQSPGRRHPTLQGLICFNSIVLKTRLALCGFWPLCLVLLVKKHFRKSSTLLQSVCKKLYFWNYTPSVCKEKKASYFRMKISSANALFWWFYQYCWCCRRNLILKVMWDRRSFSSFSFL